MFCELLFSLHKFDRSSIFTAVSRKSKASRAQTRSATLPPNWPSPLHNKCSQRHCAFPNPPQVAEGKYDCKGVPGGFFCEGTYYVSSSRADAASLLYEQEFLAEATARRRARLKKQQEEERAQIKALQHAQEQEAKRLAAAEANARYGVDRRQQERRGHKSLEETQQQQQHLERRAAQRKRNGIIQYALDPREHYEVVALHSPVIQRGHPYVDPHGHRAHRYAQVDAKAHGGHSVQNTPRAEGGNQQYYPSYPSTGWF